MVKDERRIFLQHGTVRFTQKSGFFVARTYGTPLLVPELGVIAWRKGDTEWCDSIAETSTNVGFFF